MKTLSIQVPDTLQEHECLMILGAQLYKSGLLSAGQCAEMVGVTKRTFIELLGRYGVSVFSESLDELTMDIANA